MQGQTELTSGAQAEQVLRSRLDQYTSVDQIARALEDAKVDPQAGIRVAPLKEETVNGVLIRDSGAIVKAGTRVNAHFHSGANVSKEMSGYEVYKILSGTGTISLGTPQRSQDGSFITNEEGKVKVEYEAQQPVGPGSYIVVKPGQVHSLEAGPDEDFKFVFTGSPDHLSPQDRVMAVNPEPQTNA